MPEDQVDPLHRPEVAKAFFEILDRQRGLARLVAIRRRLRKRRRFFMAALSFEQGDEGFLERTAPILRGKLARLIYA